MANGTKTFTIDGITYTANELGEGRWSVRVEDPETCEAINHGPLNWAGDEEISEALGTPVRFVDGGDHPTAIESIYDEEPRTEALIEAAEAAIDEADGR